VRKFRFTFTAKLVNDSYPAVKIRIPVKIVREHKLRAGDVVQVTVEGVRGCSIRRDSSEKIRDV